MEHISIPALTAADLYIIENVDSKALKDSINFLREYREVMWIDNDSNEIVSLSELRNRKIRIQPHPIYPDELKLMAKMFLRLMRDRDDLRVDLREQGFFTQNSLASYGVGTMFSPSLIASLICDAYSRERFCDGLFGQGVDNGLYLKMLLHLEDLINYHNYSDAHQSSTGERGAQ